MSASFYTNTALLVTGLLGVILYCEDCLNKSYFEPSMEQIKNHQKELSEDQMKWWSYVSTLGNGWSYILYYVCYCMYTGVTQLHRVAYYGVFFSLLGFTMNVTKMYFVQFRPFELDADIKMGDGSCPKEYGNPSGHSMFAPAFGGLILLDIMTSCIKLSDLH